MVTDQHIAIVKQTIPLLEQTGPKLTEHFYTRMFHHNPELKHIFNMSHQHSGNQSVALFNALAAYARHIDNLPALAAAVERIAHKHTSFDIQPEHYAIVGHHLIETLRELAGNQFTADIEEAWTAAYQQIADIFIQREGDLYLHNQKSKGGWQGLRPFTVMKKEAESDLVTSFYLEPVDGQSVLDFQPGQYLGIQVQPEQHDYLEVRQYSLSDRSNGRSYRISVKRESGDVPGLVSNHLHDRVQVGDQLKVMAPAGDFVFSETNQPVVLISAGVGSTPMQAILESLAANQHPYPVHYLHACEHAAQHSFKYRVQALEDSLPLMSHTWYRTEDSNDYRIHKGVMDLASIQEQLPLHSGNFYLCGPVAFMSFIHQQLTHLGVPANRIHYEVFGPHQTL